MLRLTKKSRRHVHQYGLGDVSGASFVGGIFHKATTPAAHISWSREN
jgi:hypothetical protein